MKKLLFRILRWGAVWLVVLAIGLVARGVYAFRDRTPGYALDLKIDAAKSRAEPRPLRVGFARIKINPDLSDPKRPVWVAGFSHHRAATAIHDGLWAIACVVDDGYTRFGVVALDAIGFFHDDAVAVRRGCAPEWKLDCTTVCATHNHSTPDLMGLWGADVLHTGVDPRYRQQVIAVATQALGEAVAAFQPARVAFHEIATPTDGLVADTRRPIVFDPDIRVLHFTSVTNGATLGSFFGLYWAESSSGERPNQGSITKSGNPRCRHALGERAWRAWQFQPDYWLVKKYKPQMANAKARSVACKQVIRALARQIGVDLWRLYTGATTPAQLGLRVNQNAREYVLKSD